MSIVGRFALKVWGSARDSELRACRDLDVDITGVCALLELIWLRSAGNRVLHSRPPVQHSFIQNICGSDRETSPEHERNRCTCGQDERLLKAET